MRRCGFFGWVTLAALAGAPVAGQAAPPPVPVVGDPLRTGFESLPETERRALQDALVWTGDFNGTVAGSYGPRTHDALVASARRIGVPPGAALDAPTRATLLAAADASRRAVGFAMVRDARTGLALGLPLKLLPFRTAIPDGSRYAAQDGTVVVDMMGKAVGAESLDDMFARLTRDTTTRRITYKLAKSDFIVVSGEIGDGKFYSRYARGTLPGASTVLRGFTLTYPKSRADMERIALAVAASFDPFPPAEAPPAAPASLAAAGTTPTVGTLSGEAVLVGPGLALTRTDQAHCGNIEIGGGPAYWRRQDPETGLALVTLPNHNDASGVALSQERDAPRLALFLVPGDADAGPSLSVAAAVDEADGRVRMPLQGAEAGVVLIDGNGALAGLTKWHEGGAISVGGVVAVAAYDVADPERIAAFLRDASVPTVPPGNGMMTAGEAVARWRPAILPLRCRAMLPAAAAR